MDWKPPPSRLSTSPALSVTRIGTAMPVRSISLAAARIRSSPLSGKTTLRFSSAACCRILSTNATGGPRKLVCECFCNGRVDQTLEVAMVLSYLADHTRADVGRLDRRHHEDRLEAF